MMKCILPILIATFLAKLAYSAPEEKLTTPEPNTTHILNVTSTETVSSEKPSITSNTTEGKPKKNNLHENTTLLPIVVNRDQIIEAIAKLPNDVKLVAILLIEPPEKGPVQHQQFQGNVPYHTPGNNYAQYGPNRSPGNQFRPSPYYGPYANSFGDNQPSYNPPFKPSQYLGPSYSDEENQYYGPYDDGSNIQYGPRYSVSNQDSDGETYYVPTYNGPPEYHDPISYS